MQDKYPNSECVTPHVIKCWKISNPKGVYKLTAGNFAGYVRMPNDKEIKKFIESGKKDNNRDTAKLLIKTLWLGGDREIYKNDQLFNSLESQLVELIKDIENEILRRIK